jgi:hypothetical protein
MKIKKVILATVFALSSTLAMAQGAGAAPAELVGDAGADPSLATPSKEPGTAGMFRSGTSGTAATPNSMETKKERQKSGD